MRRLRGLKDLLVEATVHGSRAIERIQLEKARIPFRILESIPVTAGPAKVVHVVHDASVAATHVAIRAVATGVGHAADLVLDAVGEEPPPSPRE